MFYKKTEHNEDEKEYEVLLPSVFRSRKKKGPTAARRQKRKQRKSHSRLCGDRKMVRSTLSCMNLVAKILVWSSVVALAAAVVWYSYELTNNGTDPHLIAWFSAGAFALLGFPISMWGIVSHLANYNQPNVQCYIVRILWMVPIYSMESWLCLRFHRYAIYIETLRDCYESYVLFSFFQFLIEVLGGEEELILMLKDKSPTRGVHMWGLQWCVKPWLMGQPVSRQVTNTTTDVAIHTSPRMPQTAKRIHWISPFFVRCKFGVLQYVLLKFLASLVAMILELYGLYKEGNFTPKGGYLYICILTNTSQCWALYCLILFYYATHNELTSIRPVGKFLSVKALVFFTWWQSVAISILYQMDMIPHYHALETTEEWTAEDVAKGLQDYLICIEMFLAAIVHTFVFPHTEYSRQAVEARAFMLQRGMSSSTRRYLGRRRAALQAKDDRSVCSKSSTDMEMSLGSLELVQHLPAPTNSSSLVPPTATPQPPPPPQDHPELLGEMTSPPSDEYYHNYSQPLKTAKAGLEDEIENRSDHNSLQPVIDEDDDEEDDDDDDEESDTERQSDEDEEELVEDSEDLKRPGFVRALLDSAIPRDLGADTVGIVKGDYFLEKKTLLHHAATSDDYDLFSRNRSFRKPKR